MRSSNVMVAAVLAAAAGGVAGWVARGAGPAEGESLDTERARAAVDDSEPGDKGDAVPLAPLAGAGERQAPERVPVEGAGEGVLFGPALLEFAEEGIRRGWGVERDDEPREDELSLGLERFEERTRALPAEIGRELAKRRTDAELAMEDARTGGVFSVLDRLMAEDGSGPLFEVVDSAQTFDEFFRTESQGPALDGAAGLRRREPPEDGTTFQFPAGVFQLGDFSGNWRKRFPADLTIRGAGRDATLLVLRSDLSAYQRVRNLTIEDCTIHAENNYLFDVREPSMSVTVRRARLVGWTAGAGSSCLFGTEGLALRVVDSEISGAFSRYVAYGQLFDVRHDGLLARFENCTIDAVRPFSNFGAGSTVVFANCRLTNVVGRGTREVPDSVRLLGSPVQWFEGDDPEILRRDLNELFPDWQRRMER